MSRNAGANIRDLALDREYRAIRSFTLAAGCVLSPLFLAHQKIPIPVFFYFFGLIGGGLLITQGRQLLTLAARADQGAKGEEEIGKLLKLLPSGWKTEYNRPVSGVGDVDVIVHSPQGKTWVVDVKSHGGTSMRPKVSSNVSLERIQFLWRRTSSPLPKNRPSSLRTQITLSG